MSEYLLVAVLVVIALGAVAFPLLVGRHSYDDARELDADLHRYREALDAGTVCERCREANRAGSRFCARCGRELPGA